MTGYTEDKWMPIFYTIGVFIGQCIMSLCGWQIWSTTIGQTIIFLIIIYGIYAVIWLVQWWQRKQTEGEDLQKIKYY